MNLRKPLRINVGFLVSSETGYSHDIPFEEEKLKVAEDLTLRGFYGNAHFNRTPQGLLLEAEFEGALDLECVRCLNTFEHTIHWDMTELFAFHPKPDSEELQLPEDAQIDLAPLVRDYAFTEIPIKPVCKPSCKGLCPICGQDLNKNDCGHRPDENDSPFASLRDLLKN
ncbi:MAG: hypothetical protein HFACDABA_00421 [Anaerolineales bacterium]|nr:hypothetical protein [Anaerolineales bacterium]